MKYAELSTYYKTHKAVILMSGVQRPNREISISFKYYYKFGTT
jgi:hypothetical protein